MQSMAHDNKSLISDLDAKQKYALQDVIQIPVHQVFYFFLFEILQRREKVFVVMQYA